MWALTEVLVREKQQCLEAKGQQKEQLVLLEKKRTTYSKVWAVACPPGSDPRTPSAKPGLSSLTACLFFVLGFRCLSAASLCCRGFFRSTG